MELDCHTTSLAKVPSITQTEDHNENKARKKAQTSPWEVMNFPQKAEPIRSPSAMEILVQKKDDTWDLDHSLTLVVDDDDYEQEKEVVEVKNFLNIPCFCSPYLTTNFFCEAPDI